MGTSGFAILSQNDSVLRAGQADSARDLTRLREALPAQTLSAKTPANKAIRFFPMMLSIIALLIAAVIIPMFVKMELACMYLSLGCSV